MKKTVKILLLMCLLHALAALLSACGKPAEIRMSGAASCERGTFSVSYTAKPRKGEASGFAITIEDMRYLPGVDYPAEVGEITPVYPRVIQDNARGYMNDAMTFRRNIATSDENDVGGFVLRVVEATYDYAIGYLSFIKHDGPGTDMAGTVDFGVMEILLTAENAKPEAIPADWQERLHAYPVGKIAAETFEGAFQDGFQGYLNARNSISRFTKDYTPYLESPVWHVEAMKRFTDPTTSERQLGFIAEWLDMSPLTTPEHKAEMYRSYLEQFCELVTRSSWVGVAGIQQRGMFSEMLAGFVQSSTPDEFLSFLAGYPDMEPAPLVEQSVIHSPYAAPEELYAWAQSMLDAAGDEQQAFLMEGFWNGMTDTSEATRQHAKWLASVTPDELFAQRIPELFGPLTYTEDMEELRHNGEWLASVTPAASVNQLYRNLVGCTGAAFIDADELLQIFHWADEWLPEAVMPYNELNSYNYFKYALSEDDRFAASRFPALQAEEADQLPDDLCAALPSGTVVPMWGTLGHRSLSFISGLYVRWEQKDGTVLALPRERIPASLDEADYALIFVDYEGPKIDYTFGWARATHVEAFVYDLKTNECLGRLGKRSYTPPAVIQTTGAYTQPVDQDDLLGWAFDLCAGD